ATGRSDRIRAAAPGVMAERALSCLWSYFLLRRRIRKRSSRSAVCGLITFDKRTRCDRSWSLSTSAASARMGGEAVAGTKFEYRSWRGLTAEKNRVFVGERPPMKAYARLKLCRQARRENGGSPGCTESGHQTKSFPNRLA